MPVPRLSRLLRVIYNVRKKVFATSAIILILLLVFQVSKIKQVDCTYNTLPCQKEIVEKLNLYLNRSYFQLSSDDIISNLSSIQPVDEIKTHFFFPGKLRVDIVSKENFKEATIHYLVEKPLLSLDKILESSDSAIVAKPTEEIEQFLKDKTGSGVQIWSNGKLVSKEINNPIIKIVVGQNPKADMYAQIYNFLEFVKQFANFKNIYLVDDLIFLSREGLPDIIVIVPFDESRLKLAFSSLDFLNSLKKDAKVIDMRFKNPILR